jgi:flagellar motor switch protein FliM
MDQADHAADVQQVLSQSEVEQLLAQVAEEQNSVVVHKSDSEKERQSREAIQPYDFRHPVFLSASELRKLRLRHEDFIRSLAARLSIYLRLDFALQMSKLQTVSFQKFCESLQNPTNISLFKIEPLRGICLVEVRPRLGLTIVDRLLGGPAHSVNPDRDVTDIAMALLDQAVQVVIAEWCSHWARVQDLRPILLGHETNGRFLQTAPPDTVMLVLAMEARIGDCMEQMQLAMPSYSLEPLIRQLGSAIESGARESAKVPQSPPRWNPQMDEVLIRVSAEWTNLELTAGNLAQLKTGDIIPLEPQITDRATVKLGGLPKFAAQLGTQAGKLALQVQQRIPN